MNNLITSSCLFFLEGLLLVKFSPQTLILERKPSILAALISISAYFVAFAWIWLADRSRKVGSVLISCMVLSVLFERVFYIGPNPISTFLYIFSTAMIIPLTCAFTMMQLSPIRQRERFSLQYSWLILGRLVRIFVVNKAFEVNDERELLTVAMKHSIFVLTSVILFCCFAYKITPKTIQKSTHQNLLSFPHKPVQVFTPISKLLGHSRYLLFLLAVLGSSVLFFYTKEVARNQLEMIKFTLSPLVLLSCEILTCLSSYFLVPRRISPHKFFILGQFLFIICGLILFCSTRFGFKNEFVFELFQIILSIGFIITAMANAQIIAMHAKPGLEFTTCALVEIVKNGMAPVLFIFGFNLKVF